MHIRTAFEEGACGAIAFAWTDEWWRGGFEVDDWAFGLVDRRRRPKAAARAVATVQFEKRAVPASGARHVAACLGCRLRLQRRRHARGLLDLAGASDLSGPRDHPRQRRIARPHRRDRTQPPARAGDRHPQRRAQRRAQCRPGRSQRRNRRATFGADVPASDRDWPHQYLVQPFLTSDVAGSGGPNVVPPDDAPMAQSIARAPGGPTHVLLDDRIAEHVPGCNMAFRREALLAIGGFNAVYLRAGDDVDVCWRLQARGWKIGFASAALVWHHHRSSVKAYWRQQVGYGEGETWLMAHHPEKFLDGRMLWRGRIYSPLPFVRSLWGTRINMPACGARRRFRRCIGKTCIPSRFCPIRSGGRRCRSSPCSPVRQSH